MNAFIERKGNNHARPLSSRRPRTRRANKATKLTEPALIKPPSKTSESQPAEEPSSTHCRILIVEDHVTLRAGLERFLISIGYSVSTADSVKSAIDCAANKSFDLVLIDLNLPDGTGWDLLPQLATKRAVRAIAMSGWGSDSNVASSLAAGFMQHLIKPVTPEELMEAIENVLRRPPPDQIVAASTQARKNSLSRNPQRA